jgi:hypothetical protein
MKICIVAQNVGVRFPKKEMAEIRARPTIEWGKRLQFDIEG